MDSNVVLIGLNKDACKYIFFHCSNISNGILKLLALVSKTSRQIAAVVGKERKIARVFLIGDFEYCCQCESPLLKAFILEVPNFVIEKPKINGLERMGETLLRFFAIGGRNITANDLYNYGKNGDVVIAKTLLEMCNLRKKEYVAHWLLNGSLQSNNQEIIGLASKVLEDAARFDELRKTTRKRLAFLKS